MTARSDEITDQRTTRQPNSESKTGPSGALRVGQMYSGYETVRTLKRHDKQETQLYYQLRCPSCKAERVTRSDQLSRIKQCACKGSAEEVVKALNTTYNLEDQRVHDFLRIYVLGKSKGDAVILSGILSNPEISPDHQMLVANHILTIPEVQKEHKRVKEENQIILLESTIEQLDSAIDKLQSAGDSASLRAAGALLEKKSKLVMEIQRDSSRGISADDLLDGMLAAFEDDKKKAQMESEGRCRHCGSKIIA